MIGAQRSSAAPPRREAPGVRARRRSGRARRRRRLPRLGPRALAGMLAVALLVAGGWLWLRNSSLVAVRQVSISGVSGPDADQIRSALRSAAREMTTLNVRQGALHTAVTPYPVVKRLQVSTSFPHTMSIRVIEQVPVGVISADGRRIAVAGDGTVLHDAPGTGALPTITVSVLPAGTHVDGGARADVRLLAAAPWALLAKVAQVSTASSHGLVAQMRNGPKVYFGTAADLTAKWSAAAAVLASSSSDEAAYVDVTDPSRPAAGPGSDAGGTSPSVGSASSSQGVTGSETATSSQGVTGSPRP